MKPVRVRTGITDGQKTQVTGRELVDGMQIVVGISSGSGATAGAATANPFQPTQQRQGGPRPPGTF